MRHMSSFRFPLWSIALMLIVLVDVVIAIEKARRFSFQLASGSDTVHSGWWALPGVFLAVTVVMGGVGLLAYGLLHYLGKTGAQRLSDVGMRHPGRGTP
jgi:hypothetical protein